MNTAYSKGELEDDMVVHAPVSEISGYTDGFVDRRPTPLSEKERETRGLWILRRNGFVAIASMCLCSMFLVDWMGLDLVVSSAAHVDGDWKWKDWPLWKFLYDYGPMPALLMGFGSLGYAVYLMATKAPRKKWLWALYPFACLAIAPGLFVNAMGKDQWGRPRPRDCAELGGTQAYRAFWSPDFGVEGKSFPSGHASVGFMLCCLFMLPGNKYRRFCLLLGLAYGALVGMARIAQGGHFLTDILASAGVVLCTCWILAPSLGWVRKERWMLVQ